MSVVQFNDRRRAMRRAWLGAAAAASISGAGLAEAASGYAAAYAAESSGPASFADIVEHVKGAVVSVKVKLADSAEEDSDDDSPRFPRGGPFERFFKRFGAPTPEGPRHNHGT